MESRRYGNWLLPLGTAQICNESVHDLWSCFLAAVDTESKRRAKEESPSFLGCRRKHGDKGEGLQYLMPSLIVTPVVFQVPNLLSGKRGTGRRMKPP